MSNDAASRVTRLRDPRESLKVGDRFFLTAAYSRPPAFLALEVIEKDGTSIWVKPVQIFPLSARVSDYSTEGVVIDGATINRQSFAGGSKHHRKP